MGYATSSGGNITYPETTHRKLVETVVEVKAQEITDLVSDHLHQTETLYQSELLGIGARITEHYKHVAYGGLGVSLTTTAAITGGYALTTNQIPPPVVSGFVGVSLFASLMGSLVGGAWVKYMDFRYKKGMEE